MKKIQTSTLIFMLFVLGTVTLFAQPKAGKIWVVPDHLFVNIPDQGALVVENTNPAAPELIGFVPIPGNFDIAVVGDILIANHYDELVTMDWRKFLETQDLEIFERIPNVFPNHFSNEKRTMGMYLSNASLAGSVGGSMACFGLDDPENPKYLYAISNRDLQVFDVSSPETPRKVGNNIPINDEAETICVNEGRLFIGCQEGMMIYSLEDPTIPQLAGRYTHMHGCDPVVVEGDRAYVTIRNGNRCGNTINELHIVNISNPSNCVRENTVQMTNPHGLGVDRQKVFLCDGDEGLKILDVTNAQSVREMGRETTAGRAYDVIVLPSIRRLIAVAGDNVMQYRYSSGGNLTKLSEFVVEF